MTVTADVVYSFSPVHTDAYYQDCARQILQLQVDRICIKDPSGLLTPERTRTLVPAVREVIGETPLEIHTHCIAGGEVANQVYVEAMEHGATIFHTAVRPLAYGAAQPPAEYVIEQAIKRGFSVDVDNKAWKRSPSISPGLPTGITSRWVNPRNIIQSYMIISSLEG